MKKILAPVLLLCAICLYQKQTFALIEFIGDDYKELDCGEPIPPFWGPILNNTCGSILFDDMDEVYEDDGCAGRILRIYSATNSCLQSTTWIQTINYVDNEPPTVTFPTESNDGFCYEIGQPLQYPPTFEDNCSENLTVIYSYSILETSGCNYVVSYVFEAYDECANLSIATLTVVFSSDGPQLLNVQPVCENCDPNNITDPPLAIDGCGLLMDVNYNFHELNADSTWVIWYTGYSCGGYAMDSTLYTHPCNYTSVKFGLTSGGDNEGPGVHYQIYNNQSSLVAQDWIPPYVPYEYVYECLADGCYDVYIEQPPPFGWAFTDVNGNTLLEGSADGWYKLEIGGECEPGSCANVQACDFTPFGNSLNTCCYYSCVNGEVTEGTEPETVAWSIYTNAALTNEIYSGIAPHFTHMCLLEDPFTTYYLLMTDSFCNGWNGSHFLIDIPEWNWSFDTTLVSGCSLVVPFTTGGPGCMTPGMCNYNPLATIDDGSCAPIVTAQMLMFDSGANGWGNWWYSIINSESDTIQTGTLPAGASGMDEFCLIPGCYEIKLSKLFGGGGNGTQVTWTLQYADGTEIISGVAPDNQDFGFSIPGNQNNDCAVNAGDLLLFMAAYGCNGFCGLPDLNFDNTVNTSDLLLFMGAFGDVYN